MIFLKVTSKSCVPCFVGSLEELIAHGLRALRDTLPGDVNLTTKVGVQSTNLGPVGHCLSSFVHFSVM